MTDLLDNPPDSAREPLRRAVTFYRERRQHPNWLNDQWADGADESYADIRDSPRYVDQLAAYAGLLLVRELHKAGHSILSPENQKLATVAGLKLLLSELSESEQASIQKS
jgi:hypothetical protein